MRQSRTTTSSSAESSHYPGTIVGTLHRHWLLRSHRPLPPPQPLIPEGASLKTTSRIQTISHLHHHPLLHFHHVLRHQRWPRSCPSRPQCCLKPKQTVRWTGRMTPTSHDTASVTRFLMEKWLAVIIQIVQLSGFITAAWG